MGTASIIHSVVMKFNVGKFAACLIKVALQHYPSHRAGKSDNFRYQQPDRAYRAQLQNVIRGLFSVLAEITVQICFRTTEWSAATFQLRKQNLTRFRKWGFRI